MTKPPHICPCGSITPHGALCACQAKAKRERNARHDANRPSAGARGYDHRWRKARAIFLAEHPTCATPDCGQPATVVDHIVRHCGDPNLFNDLRNWQPLCAPCHNSRKQRIERKN